MSNRIGAIAVAAAALSALLVASPPSHAAGGPDDTQPATERITSRDAHRVASWSLQTYYVAALPKPHKGYVAACTGGPYVWRCPAWWRGADSECRATVVVWSDEPSGYYFELHRLRCGD